MISLDANYKKKQIQRFTAEQMHKNDDFPMLSKNVYIFFTYVGLH